jgi:mannose-6-phosphate isomerase-like protein (cupin superfamily)
MREGIFRFPSDGEYYFEEGCFILELYNSSEDPAVSIARARVQPGITTRLHKLEGASERYVILEGEGRVEVGTLPPQTVNPGDVVLIPPGCPQRITNTGPGDLIFLVVCSPRFTRNVYQNLEDPR